MPETRYQELLGLDPEITQPDYFQLLLLTPETAAPEAIEARFKEQMTKLQMSKSNKHKEFIEYLKGEIKNARRVLSDIQKRREYVDNLRQERLTELRKYLTVLLVDKTLSMAAERMLLTQARNLGLVRTEATRAIEEELKRAGGRRVQSKAGPAPAEQALMKKLERYAEAWRQAKLEAKLAEEKVLEAEQLQREVEELEKTASQREQRAAAMETTLLQKHQGLMGRFREAQQNLSVKAQELLARERDLLSWNQELEEKELELSRGERRIGTAVATLKFYLTLGVIFVVLQVLPYLLPESVALQLREKVDGFLRLQSQWNSTSFWIAIAVTLTFFIAGIVSFLKKHPIVGNVFLFAGFGVVALIVIHVARGSVVL